MVGSCIRLINILKPKKIYATFVINKVLNVDAMLVGILLRDLARDFRVVFRELVPSRVLRNPFARGKNYRGPP